MRAHVHVTTLPLSDREEFRASTDPFLYFPTATPPGENACPFGGRKQPYGGKLTVLGVRVEEGAGA